MPATTSAPTDSTAMSASIATARGLKGEAETSPASVVSAERQPSKSEEVLKLLRRKRGATLAELQAATGWQAHSVRGFLSGTVRKRMGLTLGSETGTDGVRRYVLAKA